MKTRKLLTMFILVMLILPTNLAITEKSKSQYIPLGELYLRNNFPNEDIYIIGTDSYTNYETGVEYTLVKAFHNDSPITIAINHNTSLVSDHNLIESEHVKYINSLPAPYRKMDRSLRMAQYSFT